MERLVAVEKAAEDCRTPRRSRDQPCRARISARSWTAAVLCRCRLEPTFSNTISRLELLNRSHCFFSLTPLGERAAVRGFSHPRFVGKGLWLFFIPKGLWKLALGWHVLVPTLEKSS